MEAPGGHDRAAELGAKLIDARAPLDDPGFPIRLDVNRGGAVGLVQLAGDRLHQVRKGHEALEHAVFVDYEGDVQRRAAARAAESAWRSLSTARAQETSFETGVRASSLALDGVRREAELGARTVLDILDAEQELLDAKVNLVRARRDEIVSAYAVLASAGGLTAQGLGLDVPAFDMERNYKAVRDKFWGTGIDSE